VKISKEMIGGDGRMKPNECKGYCERLHMVVKDVNFPVRRNDLGELSTNHHTADGKCMVEHEYSTRIDQIIN